MNLTDTKGYEIGSTISNNIVGFARGVEEGFNNATESIKKAVEDYRTRKVLENIKENPIYINTESDMSSLANLLNDNAIGKLVPEKGEVYFRYNATTPDTSQYECKGNYYIKKSKATLADGITINYRDQEFYKKLNGTTVTFYPFANDAQYPENEFFRSISNDHYYYIDGNFADTTSVFYEIVTENVCKVTESMSKLVTSAVTKIIYDETEYNKASIESTDEEGNPVTETIFIPKGYTVDNYEYCIQYSESEKNWLLMNISIENSSYSIITDNLTIGTSDLFTFGENDVLGAGSFFLKRGTFSVTAGVQIERAIDGKKFKVLLGSPNTTLINETDAVTELNGYFSYAGIKYIYIGNDIYPYIPKMEMTPITKVNPTSANVLIYDYNLKHDCYFVRDIEGITNSLKALLSELSISSMTTGYGNLYDFLESYSGNPIYQVKYENDVVNNGKTYKKDLYNLDGFYYGITMTELLNVISNTNRVILGSDTEYMLCKTGSQGYFCKYYIEKDDQQNDVYTLDLKDFIHDDIYTINGEAYRCFIDGEYKLLYNIDFTTNAISILKISEDLPDTVTLNVKGIYADYDLNIESSKKFYILSGDASIYKSFIITEQNLLNTTKVINKNMILLFDRGITYNDKLLTIKLISSDDFLNLYLSSGTIIESEGTYLSFNRNLNAFIEELPEGTVVNGLKYSQKSKSFHRNFFETKLSRSLSEYLIFPKLGYPSRVDIMDRLKPYFQSLIEIEKSYTNNILSVYTWEERAYTYDVFKIIKQALLKTVRVELSENRAITGSASWMSFDKQKATIFGDHKDKLIECSLNGSLSALTQGEISKLLQDFAREVVNTIESRHDEHLNNLKNSLNEATVNLGKSFIDFKTIFTDIFGDSEFGSYVVTIGGCIKDMATISWEILTNLVVDYDNLSPGYCVYDTYRRLIKELIKKSPETVDIIKQYEFFFLLSVFFEEDTETTAIYFKPDNTEYSNEYRASSAYFYKKSDTTGILKLVATFNKKTQISYYIDLRRTNSDSDIWYEKTGSDNRIEMVVEGDEKYFKLKLPNQSSMTNYPIETDVFMHGADISRKLESVYQDAITFRNQYKRFINSLYQDSRQSIELSKYIFNEYDI